jgi:hypothetical protein
VGWQQAGPAIAQNEDGAIVRPDGQDRIIYVKGELGAEIEVEFGGPFVIVYSDSVRWSGSAHETPMSNERQRYVLGEVLDALRCLGCDYETR